MTGRAYDLVHRTRYRYAEAVTASYGRAVLSPRTLPDQVSGPSEVTVSPEPADTDRHTDWFGNTSTYFAVTTTHTCLLYTSDAADD